MAVVYRFGDMRARTTEHGDRAVMIVMTIGEVRGGPSRGLSSRSPPPLRPGRLIPGPGFAARSALEGAQVREDRRT